MIASPARQALGVALAEDADRPRLWPGVGRRSSGPFILVIADDSAQLFRLSHGRAPGWGAGLAFPAARTIMLRADLPDLHQTLRHELAHLILREAVRARVPLWFDEGYASWASGELGRMEALELNLAVATGKLPRFETLDAMLRGSASSADLAYTLAASAVAELARRPPDGAIERVIDHLAAGQPFDAAVETSTGLNIDRFEESWQHALRQRYSLLTWFAAGGLWGVMALLVLGLAWLRQGREAARRVALNSGWVVAADVQQPLDENLSPTVDETVDPEGPAQ
ncbi:MAG: hypothetical protein ABI587_09465 [Gemmatimonadales bacterium]